MDERIRSIFHLKVAEEGFAKKLGIRLMDVREGYALVEMVPTKEDVNIHGLVHGGAIFSLMDEAFQISCNSHGTVALALNVNVIFHHPASEGVRLRAESREVDRGKKTATYDIKVRDEDDILIASCQALAYRKREALPFLAVE